ncbi:hypothetical protein ACFFX0_27150 [Citricoccus parietis]|uniref:Uncharacterized protein n=1 Tax=Citricoccus parietis TaxID=592307 RepID=A0ABV5G6U6_9MICC
MSTPPRPRRRPPPRCRPWRFRRRSPVDRGGPVPSAARSPGRWARWCPPRPSPGRGRP